MSQPPRSPQPLFLFNAEILLRSQLCAKRSLYSRRAPLNRRFNPALSERVMIGTIARMGHNILLAALALITVAICLQFR